MRIDKENVRPWTVANPAEYRADHILSLPSRREIGRTVYIQRLDGNTSALSQRDKEILSRSFIPEDQAVVYANYSYHPPRRFVCAWRREHLAAAARRHAIA